MKQVLALIYQEYRDSKNNLTMRVFFVNLFKIILIVTHHGDTVDGASLKRFLEIVIGHRKGESLKIARVG